MPFSLRLDPDTDATIRRLSAETGRSRSALVREAVAQYAAAGKAGQTAARSAYDRLKPYIGIADTGGANLSSDTHAKYHALLARKYRRAKRSR